MMFDLPSTKRRRKMPPKNEIKIENGTIYVNGVDIANDGIPDLDLSDVDDYFRDNKTISLSDSGELTCTCSIPRITMLKLVGLWDYAYTYCPSARVKYLMLHGKNERIKYKNYRHAMNLIAKYLIKGWWLPDNLRLIKKR